MTCQFPNCDREAKVKGHCIAHYHRQRRGSTNTGPLGAKDGTTVRVMLTPLRVTPATAGELYIAAEENELTPYKQHQKVVEDWAGRRQRGEES